MIKKEVVSFKESKQLFGDNGLHSLRDERSKCNRAVVLKGQIFPFLGIEKTCKFPRRRE